jgi:hypothetical protein
MTQDFYRTRIEEELTKYQTPQEKLAFQDGIAFQLDEIRKMGFEGIFKGYTHNGNAKKEIDKETIESTGRTSSTE